MGFSVLDALDMESMAGTRVLAGANHLDNEVRSVGVMEVPDILPWVASGDLLLTTLFPIHNDAAAQRELIVQLHERGLSGLAIKPSRYVDRVPREMIEHADALGFPLLEIPFSTSFNTLMVSILSQILEHRADQLERSRRIQSNVTTIVLQGGELPEIAQALSELLGLSITIHDHLTQPLTGHVFPHQDLQLSQLMALSSLPLPQDFTSIAALEIPYAQATRPVLVQPVSIKQRTWGYIIAWTHPEETPKDFEMVLSHGATVVGLLMMKKQAMLEVEKRYRSEFVEDWLQMKLSPETIEERGSLYGWDLRRPHVPVVIALSNPKPVTPLASGHHPWWSDFKQLYYLSVTATQQLHPEAIVVERARSILLLLPITPGTRPEESEASARQLASRLYREIIQHLQQPAISVGIGPQPPQNGQMGKAVMQAEQTVRVGLHRPKAEPVWHFNDLGVDRLLSELPDQSVLEEFRDDILGSLFQYDQEHNVNWIQTLNTFVSQGCNIQDTAEQLFIHYNTVRYRIKRIEEILWREFRNPEDLLCIQMALKIHQQLSV